MTQRLSFLLVLGLIMLLIDIYAFQAVRMITGNLSSGAARIIHIIYWTFSAICLAAFAYYHLSPYEFITSGIRTAIATGLFVIYFSKVFIVLFTLIDDLRRMVLWISEKVKGYFAYNNASPDVTPSENAISRSEFLAKTGVIISAVPFVTMGYGIISGAHDYRVIRKQVYLKNLPAAFDGIKIAQISDIHTGSFYNKTAVKGGIEMLLKEKPDLAFFTGDLVNTKAEEVKDYIDLFEKVKAPLGVYSTLGNHDYGNYHDWSSEAAKKQNLNDLMTAHKLMGWNLLNNENRIIKVDNEQLAIIGVENWGSSDWQPKLGDIEKGKKGTEDVPVKLLLSHDPSHWEAEVIPKHKDIDIMFAGHTHGFQFGIELGDFIKWSPSQYYYKQWAGLYQQDEQYVYVNRGYGYIGFPGRIGMPPEITILELKKA